MTNSLADIVVKATDGPWACNNGVGVVFGPDCEVARCGDFNDPELIPFNAERWRADARLIALAPTLATLVLEAREALTKLLVHWTGEDGPNDRDDDDDIERRTLATLAKLESL